MMKSIQSILVDFLKSLLLMEGLEVTPLAVISAVRCHSKTSRSSETLFCKTKIQALLWRSCQWIPVCSSIFVSCPHCRSTPLVWSQRKHWGWGRELGRWGCSVCHQGRAEGGERKMSKSKHIWIYNDPGQRDQILFAWLLNGDAFRLDFSWNYSWHICSLVYSTRRWLSRGDTLQLRNILPSTLYREEKLFRFDSNDQKLLTTRREETAITRWIRLDARRTMSNQIYPRRFIWFYVS